MQSAGLAPNQHERRRDGRRASQQGAGVVPPSPALVRHGSKQRKVPAALAPGGVNVSGQYTPHSAAAQVNVPIGTPQPRSSAQHPYASVTGGYDYNDDNFVTQQQYGRVSPMVSSVGAAPPALSNVRARGGDIGVSHGGEYQAQDIDDTPKPNILVRILTCRCG